MEPHEKPPIADTIKHFYPDWHCQERGGWESVRCPFHGDTSPSATVSTDLNQFKCFACDAGGDSWWVIMNEENIEFRAAVEFADRILDFRDADIHRTARKLGSSHRIPFDGSRAVRGHRSILSTRPRRRPFAGP
ncbi:CHC2 zinc finger domain-containing protein [Streptomyces sp. 769]|uniref:CHC2 zinc finger domain-containing protein n=1 Tax=Streptomyces sp. 769 TaxID=1262452 RepID=UPI000581CE1D|nr:CHC2 zinc finger domain-containing protein [Streptomyces sp. 769]AJC53973.1 hypothetical protein GZL_01373 [Streptomyces sp. 769]